MRKGFSRKGEERRQSKETPILTAVIQPGLCSRSGSREVTKSQILGVVRMHWNPEFWVLRYKRWAFSLTFLLITVLESSAKSIFHSPCRELKSIYVDI